MASLPVGAMLSSVGTCCRAVIDQQEKWEMIADLMGGTLAMRQAGTRWLPKEPKEKDEVYAIRKSRSFLYNVFKDTVDRVKTKPFTRQVKLTGKLPERLKPLEKNCDGLGSSVTDFAQQLLGYAAQHGLVHVVPEFPSTDATKNAKTEAEQNPTPYWIVVPATELIGWETETINGHVTLSLIRIRERRVVRKTDSFEETCVEFIRVYTKTEWAVYEPVKDGAEKYRVVGQGTHTLGEVPLKTYYVNRTGFLTADAPFEELAWMNIRHWQSSSDQNNILRIARVGILFLKGFAETETRDITVGPNMFITSTNQEADAKFVEHEGKALGAGENDLKSLKEDMQILGLQPFIQRHSGATATGVAVDETRANSEVEAWCRALEIFIRELFAISCKWIKLTLDAEFKIDINTDFGISVQAVEYMRLLLEAYRAGACDRMTLLSEFRRRGVFHETVKIEEVAERAAEESMLGLDGGEGGGSSKIGGIPNFGGRGGAATA